MTNTNELTAKLKAAAHDEIMCREACDTSDLWQDVASPENVLALTEALEAANELNKHLELATRKAEGCSEALRRRAEAAEKRIAELEARTLTVKLPPRVDSSNVPFAAHSWNACLDEVEQYLSRAGIKFQIEGE